MRPVIFAILGLALVVVTYMAARPVFFQPSGADAARTVQSGIPDRYIDPDQLREYHDLTAKQKAALARSARKQEVATLLINGELTFAETALRFREITMTDPAGITYLRRAYPTAADGELHFRNVI